MIELVLSIALYALFGALANAGFGAFADETETFTITVGQASSVLGSLVGIVGTFMWSRVAKAKGKLT